jgi:UDP-glucose 4-epimerase
MKLLITGVAGFIGSKIAHEAIKRGYKVYGVDDLSQGDENNIPQNVNFIRFNLSEKKRFIQLPKDINIIFHLAGQSSGEVSFDDPVEDLNKNTISTLNLIEYGIENKIQKIVYASSMSVYGAVDTALPVSENTESLPLSCYGVGKSASEKYLNIYKDKLPFIIFRMFNVYGPGQNMNNLRQGMVSIFLQYALTQNNITVKGSLERYRDFIYIDDVVDIWMQSITNNLANNQIFNLGTGIKTKIKDLLLIIKKLYPSVIWFEASGTMGDQFGLYANIDKLREFFSINEVTSLEDGLKYFYQSMK